MSKRVQPGRAAKLSPEAVAAAVEAARGAYDAGERDWDLIYRAVLDHEEVKVNSERVPYGAPPREQTSEAKRIASEIRAAFPNAAALRAYVEALVNNRLSNEKPTSWFELTKPAGLSINEAASVALAAYRDKPAQVYSMASKSLGRRLAPPEPEEPRDGKKRRDEDLERRVALRKVDTDNHPLAADAPHADRRKAVPEDWYHAHTAAKIPAYDPTGPREKYLEDET